MSDFSTSSLPRSWNISKIGDFAHTTSGGTPKRSSPEYYDGDIPWVKSGDLNDSALFGVDEHISDLGLKNSSAKLFKPETVLIALYGATIGRLSILKTSAATNQAICGITLPEGMSNLYLFYYLLSTREKLISKGKGGAQPNISQAIIREIDVPLAPPEQQKLIVAKIEELFSHIDAGIAALNKSKQLLKQYRQSVLKAAVTGELTKQWREENKEKLEPASELLEQILIERRKKWEALQMGQFETKGKVPKNDKWKEKYQEPVTPLACTAPSTWVIVTLDQVTEYITSGSRGWAKYYADSGATFIRAQNLKHDELRLDDVAFVTLPNAAEGMRTRVKLSDVLITITGANVTKTGIVNIDIEEGYVSQHVALCRLVLPDTAEYIYQFLISKEGGRKHLEAAAYGAGKPGLNLENIKTLSIPLPSLVEQVEIKNVVSDLLSKAERLQHEINDQLIKAKKTKQSILASAFSGKLV